MHSALGELADYHVQQTRNAEKSIYALWVSEASVPHKQM